MKVLQVHTTYRQPGGEDRVVAAEAAVLRAAGHEVVLHSAANPEGPRSALALAASSWNPVSARNAAELVRRTRPDVAHVHNTWYAMSPSVPAALASAGVPVVATLHNYRRMCVNASLYRDGHPCEDCIGRTPWPGVRHRCYRSSVVASAAAAASIRLNQRYATLDASVRLYLAVNEFARQRFLRDGVPAEKLVVKSNFVRDPGPRVVAPSASGTVLVVGRVSRDKGVDLLVQAWRSAWPELQRERMRLVVVGDGDDRQRLEALGVEGVEFVGTRDNDQVHRLMLSARALAFPSVLYEGQPMTVLEAMASGLPVLAADRGGTPELLRGVTGSWVVPAGDPEAWAGALGRLAQAGPEADAAGQELRHRYERGHTERAGLRALEVVYEQVLG